MKISYAHMGPVTMVYKMILEALGHEVIHPQPPTAQTLSLGAQYAPEFACIPFKIVLGTYIETMRKGATALVSAGGYGPCRAGLYGEVHQRILRDLGYDPQIIFFYPPIKKPKHFFTNLKILKNKHSWLKLVKAIVPAWKKLKALDDLEVASHQIRAFEEQRGSTTIAYRKGLTYLENAKNHEIKEAKVEGLNELAKVKVNHQRKPFKVGIIGEIYVQLEPFANFHLEELLGELGVIPQRTIFMTHFTRHDILFTSASKNIKKLARPYLSQLIGGHGLQSVGDTIHFSKMGFDGVIQLAPFTCIPEIVAKSLLPKISQEYDIPVMTFFIDEQTGQAGIETRLEAFVDLMEQKRAQKNQA